jgi:hypothetical protein
LAQLLLFADAARRTAATTATPLSAAATAERNARLCRKCAQLPPDFNTAGIERLLDSSLASFMPPRRKLSISQLCATLIAILNATSILAKTSRDLIALLPADLTPTETTLLEAAAKIAGTLL